MRSVTSYFNPTLFRKNLARFWPIWGLYGLIWLSLLPIGILLESAEGWTLVRAHELPLQYLEENAWFSPATFTALIFSILAAMAVFSYLYNSRSVGLFHALPLRREGLFLTNYLSGLCFFLAPNLIVFLLALAAEAAQGAVVLYSLAIWLVVQSLLCLFFYSFAVFCAMFTGHILALPVFYGILNLLAAALASLLERMAGKLLFGFESTGWLVAMADWFTPLLLFSNRTGITYPLDANGSYLFDSAHYYGLGYVILYAFFGLGLAVLALLVYRRRQLERAGDVVSVGWVRPVFKYGVAFCCAVSLGTALHSTLSSLLPSGTWPLLALMLLCGAVGYFIAEMLLRKSFRIFSHSWKGCVAFLCCLGVAMCVLELDLPGFENRVPDSSQVTCASISRVYSAPHDRLWYGYYKLDDPEELEALTDLHRSIVAHKAELENDPNLHSEDWIYNDEGANVQTRGSTSLRICYTLTDGSELIRSYDLPLTPELLEDPDTPAAQLSALINQPGLLEESYFSDVDENSRLIDASLCDLYDPDSDSYYTVYFTGDTLERLLEAIRADLADGSLGRRYLLEDQQRRDNCYYCDLSLTFLAEGAPVDEACTITITPQTTATRTLEVLTQYGGVDPSHMLTQSQFKTRTSQ